MSLAVSLADYLPPFAAANLHAELDGDTVKVSTGEPSKNLFILAMTNQAFADLPPDTFNHLIGCPIVNGPTIQYFYRCSRSEASRSLSEGITLHGDGSQVETFPTASYGAPIGTLRQIPEFTWKQHCALVEAIRTPAEVPEVRELTDSELAEQEAVLTESNIAMVFESKYRNSLRYCHSWGEWLIWVQTHWKTDKTLLAHDYAASLCRQMNPQMKAAPAKASFARGVEFLCRAKRSFATETADWDKDNYLFNTPAGSIDLQTGQIRQHSPADHLTQCAAVSPSEAKRPIFDRFLRDITLEDSALAVYLQTAMGACLSGAIEDNFLLFLFGNGQNGKNCFGDLIQKIMGSYAVTINADTLMAPRGGTSQHLTFIADLRGKRLALSSEVEEGSYFNESRLKSLTGDAVLKANRMRQDPFEFPKTHHHVIYGNHRPMLRIVDEGMKARLHMVPFRAYFPVEARDPDMAAKLMTEAPQILQWLIEGHELWMEAGKVLRKCSAVQAETESYFAAQSTNDMWVSETCDVDGEARETAKALYQSFKAWKESRGEGVQSQTRWGEWMSQRFSKHFTHGRVMYSGLTLKPMSILDSAL